MQHEPAIQPQLIDSHGVARLYNISQRTVWRLCKLQKLPPPVRVSQRATRWRLTDLLEHISQMQPANPLHEDAKLMPDAEQTKTAGLLQPGSKPN